MATETKLPVTKKKASEPAFAGEGWRPFEVLRNEVERLFDDFDSDFWRRPFRQLSAIEKTWPKTLVAVPAVDVAESEKAYEISVELPGMDQNDIEVALTNGELHIKGEKKEETKEEKKDYYVSERRYGAFERYFTLPDSVDGDRIDANFKNGVLKVTLPKTVEAQKPAKKIEVKGA
jgi:HSP20 family protein